jgi:hypothetical protein
MKTLLKILVLTLCTVNCFAQDNKEDAKSFFKAIVKTYFDKDCDKFYSLFGDSATIISPNGVGIYSTKEMAENRKACEKFEEFTKRLSSFQYYIDEYEIIVLNKKEFTSKNNDSIIKKISAEQTDNVFVYEILQEFNKNYTNCDFLIFGNIHKSDSNKNISRGLFWMIVRKTKYGWKIFGTKA